VERERWAEVKRILGTCLELEPDERASYIGQSCGGDASLMADVHNMLAANAALGGFLETPILGDDSEEILTGSPIGNYVLRELIAEGGMGKVYRAVRVTDFQKNVAIKLVKRGMDTEFILRRFRQERQMLAGLDHPNVARLLDGGATADGRPYLVMEYIEGTTITEFAEQRGLGIRARLELLRTVCSAVQFAHQNLVVHRDLKPGNILVTADGTPKLLDFGIAKLMEPDADATMASARLMTPECASPEQVTGEPITTASDIYSLGVLLYHLLTGERPYEFTTRLPAEVARVVCETEPKRPSKVRPLPDDLDNIVLKAMQKEPARRYVSAEQLAEDIRRYLEGLPVSARKDTFGYRARKFTGRHKAASFAAALIGLSLAVGMGATLWEAQLARVERARAVRRFDDVRQLADSLIFELHDAIQPLPGSTTARKLLLDRGLHYLDTLAKESSDDPSLQRDIAGAYERVGLVQGKYGDANLGDSAGALVSLRKALAIRQDIARRNPANPNDGRALASAYRVVAMQLSSNGAAGAALSEIRKAVQISEELRNRAGADFDTLRELGADYDVFGVIQGGSPGSLGDLDGAFLSYRKALAADEAMLRIDPASEVAQNAIEIDCIHLGRALAAKGDFAGALVNQRKALEIARELSAGSTSATRKRDVAVAYSSIAACYEGLGDLKQALASYTEGRKVYLELAAADPANATAQRGLAIADVNTGSILVKTGRVREGLVLLDDGVRIDERLTAADPAGSIERSRLAQILVSRGEARELSGILTGALSDFQKALFAVQSQAQAPDNLGNAAVQLRVARSHLPVARLSAKVGLSDQAAASLQKALGICENYLEGGQSRLEALEVAAEAYAGLGDLANARGSSLALPIAERIKGFDSARSCYRKGLGLRQSMGNPGASPAGSNHAIDPKRLTARIAECNRQLARLHRAGTAPQEP